MDGGRALAWPCAGWSSDRDTKRSKGANATATAPFSRASHRRQGASRRRPRLARQPGFLGRERILPARPLGRETVDGFIRRDNEQLVVRRQQTADGPVDVDDARRTVRSVLLKVGEVLHHDRCRSATAGDAGAAAGAARARRPSDWLALISGSIVGAAARTAAASASRTRAPGTAAAVGVATARITTVGVAGRRGAAVGVAASGRSRRAPSRRAASRAGACGCVSSNR